MELSNPEPLDCAGVEVHFGSLKAVNGANLAVAAGEIVAILGRSGSGKTTLLRAIAGFERVAAGEIRIGGRVVESTSVSVPAHKRSVGLVFQDYALFPNRTVAANIAYGLARGSESRVTELLRRGDLEGLGGRYPHQLSGGQQQRVAVLRSLAPHPRILLLDEPFSNLDAALRLAMREELVAILRAEGMTAVLVTHDRTDAMAAADRIAVMEAGKVIETATPVDLYMRPASKGAAVYAADAQFFPGIATGDTAETPLGTVRLVSPLRGPCEVLVRPEWVGVKGLGVAATVVSRRFEGAHARLVLSVPGNPPFVAVVPSWMAAEANDSFEIGVSVPVPAYPVEEAR